MLHIVKVISKLFGFDYNKKLYQCYQFIVIDSNNIVLLYIWSYLIMSNITKLEFVGLDISWKNYLFWIIDAEMHLNAMNIGITIKEGN